jgi:septal ring factor EnvC (AmiA/AmiB activator)
MDWTQTLTIIISVFGLFLVAVPFLISRMDSFQKENNAKFEQLLNRMDSNKKDTDLKIESLQKENNTRFNGIENRLTSLEAEVKNTNQRIDSTNQRITDLKVDMNQRLSNIENCVMPRKVFHFEESHKEDPEEPKEN